MGLSFCDRSLVELRHIDEPLLPRGFPGIKHVPTQVVLQSEIRPNGWIEFHQIS